MLEQNQNGWAAPGLLPMDQAPRDGTRFIAVIDGLPYLSYYDAIGRFIRVAHCSIEGRGACWEMKTIDGQEWRWEMKTIDGQEWRRQIQTGAPATYERHHLIWSKGFDFKPEGWIPCLGNVAPRLAAPASQDAQDAARYRWLRDFHDGDEGVQDHLPYIAAGADNEGAWALCGIDADEAIDAALAAQQAGEKP